MRKGVKLVVKATSLRGNQSIDTYTPDGFAQAMDRLQKECPGRDAVLEARGLGFESDQRPSCGGPASLEFLGPCLFRFENPRFRGLDFLGFPWILSSESRLISGLHGIFAEKFFVALLLLGIRSGGTEGSRRGDAEAQKGS
jgi:hypothetical protein